MFFVFLGDFFDDEDDEDDNDDDVEINDDVDEDSEFLVVDVLVKVFLGFFW